MQTSRRGLWLLACVSFALIPYSRTLTAYFLSDDFRLIGEVATHGFFLARGGFIRPTVVLTYLVDFEVWGLNPIGFHLTNVLLHALNAALVGALAAALLRIRAGEVDRELVALAGSTIFLALPCHSESVSWISGRTDLVASVFMLLALLGHVTFLETRRRSLVMGSVAMFALALLSKESAVVLPVVVAVLTLAFTRRLQTALSSAAPFVAVLAGYAALRYLALGQLVGGYGTEAHLALDARRTVWHIVSSSVRVLLPPLPPEVTDLLARNWYMSPHRWLALSVAGAALIALAARTFRDRSGWRAGWQLIPALAVCFWITVPLLGNQGVLLEDTRGERFLYFGSAFVAIGAVCLAARIPCRRWPLSIGMGAWIVASSIAVWHVDGTWAAAGSLAQRLATETAALASGRQVIVANVPDNYRGAWVFRIGLPEAVTIFQRPAEPVSRLEVLSRHPIRSLGDEVVLKKSDGGWSLELPGDQEPETRVAPSAVILWRSAHGFGFEAISPDVDILYYSAGRIRRVGDSSAVPDPAPGVR